MLTINQLNWHKKHLSLCVDSNQLNGL